MSKQSQPSCLNAITDLLNHCDTDQGVFPPTDLYNEGWLLRIVLDWFSKHDTSDHELSFTDGCIWFSEALLPSQFLPRFRGDRLSESWTHADGVIGHIRIGRGGKADTTVLADADHFVITEAKMFSKLSAGVKNASYFNQGARYVACMAELLSRAELKPADLTRLGLYVLAPAEAIGNAIFDTPLDKGDIRQKVEQRVQAYDGDKAQWFDEWFLPVLEQAEIKPISWESIIDYIEGTDLPFATSLQDFYSKCVKHNRPANYKRLLDEIVLTTLSSNS